MGVDHGGDLYGLFAPDSEVTLNGERLYFSEQAPDYVPVPTRADLETVDTDTLSALSDFAPQRTPGRVEPHP